MSKYTNSADQFDQSGQSGQSGQLGQSGQSGQSGQFDQFDQFDQDGGKFTKGMAKIPGSGAKRQNRRRYNMDDYSLGEIITLANGARAQVVEGPGPNGQGNYKRLQFVKDGIVRGSTKSRSTTRTWSGQRTSAPVPNVQVALKLLREYYARKFPGEPKRATTAMRKDRGRIRKAGDVLLPGSPRSALYRGRTGPGRYDFKGLDDGIKGTKSRVTKKTHTAWSHLGTPRQQALWASMRGTVPRGFVRA